MAEDKALPPLKLHPKCNICRLLNSAPDLFERINMAMATAAASHEDLRKECAKRGFTILPATFTTHHKKHLNPALWQEFIWKHSPPIANPDIEGARKAAEAREREVDKTLRALQLARRKEETWRVVLPFLKEELSPQTFAAVTEELRRKRVPAEAEKVVHEPEG